MTLEVERAVALERQIALAEELLEQRRLGEATTAFDVAEQMGADADGCAGDRWMAAMLGGDFEAAWRESDAIRRRGGEDPHRFWRGEDVRGKRVMVRCLHGFGDAIQFLRYMPRLRAMAKQVIVQVPPRMVEFAPMLDGVDEVITWGEKAPLSDPAWEIQIEVMELPYLFRTAQTDLPVAVTYLRPPGEEITRAAQWMGETRGLRVGLVWAAGEWNRQRSIPVTYLGPLVRIKGVEFWSLQGGEARVDGSDLVNSEGVRDAEVCGGGLRSLAAVIANLDLVISVDTLAVHLAGAMGKPVWVLLQHAADWRWMTERCDTPWYPKTRLFRQDSAGNWSGVVQRVQAELSRFAKSAYESEAAS